MPGAGAPLRVASRSGHTDRPQPITGGSLARLFEPRGSDEPARRRSDETVSRSSWSSPLLPPVDDSARPASEGQVPSSKVFACCTDALFASSACSAGPPPKCRASGTCASSRTRAYRTTRRTAAGRPRSEFVASVCIQPRRGSSRIALMILPQVHLRKPCYDFYFL